MAKKPITDMTPLGTNSLSSKAMWDERTLYREEAHKFKFYPTIDMFYGPDLPPGKLLYGRVNPAGYPVFLAEENLKQVPSPAFKDTTVFVLNFVADAYRDFMVFWMSRVKSRGFVSEDSPYYEVAAKGGWQSLHLAYHQMQSDQYDMITNHKLFLSTTRDEKVVNLEGFIKVYLDFQSDLIPYFPVSRSQWLASRWSSPMISGLMIDLLEGAQHGDEYVKFAGLITDESYDLFAAAALRYGFVVDKNAPWRLVADISSPPMEKYLAQYGVKNLEELFDAYYTPAYLTDLEQMRQYLKTMYKSFIVANPNVKRRVVTSMNKSTYKLTQRATLTDEEFEKKYPPAWWIRLYIYIRARETYRKWDQRRFEKVVLLAQEREKYLNMEAALRYINTAVGGYKHNIHGYTTLEKQEVEEVLRDRSTKPRGGTYNF